MAASFLTDALWELKVALDEAQLAREFVESAHQLRPRLGKIAVLDYSQREGKRLLESFLNQRFANPPIIYNGLWAIVAAAFEEYLRRVLRDAITAINRKEAAFNNIPEPLQKQNILRTGQALTTVHEPLDYLPFDYEVFGKNLATCVKGSPAALLNADAFTMALTGMGPGQLEEIAHRLGFELNWDQLATSAIQKAFDTQGEPRQTSNALQSYLRVVAKTRNRIAHTGGKGVTVSSAELDKAIFILGIVSEAFAAVIRKNVGA